MRRLALVGLLLTALGAVGCGVGAGDVQKGTSLVVTENFGAESLIDGPDAKVGGSDTVMRYLQRNAKVTTKYGGGFVQSIDGRSGGTRSGRPVDWFYYVNGVLADKGAASTKLRENDTVWWDFHDWGSGGNGTSAVVGAFPEPFTHGIDGRKLPVRLECIDVADAGCNAVQKKLTAVGVVAAKGGLARSLTMETLRVLVGPYAALRADNTARTLERGPQVSGVYAKPSSDGRTIAVLDARGRTRSTLGAGSGLVAATRLDDGQPVWIVTGTDAAGVSAAASTLDEATLKNRFALAVDDGRGVAVPAP